MIGLNGVRLSPDLELLLGPLAPLLRDGGVTFGNVKYFYGAPEAFGIVLLFGVALLAPNSHQMLGYMQPLATDTAQAPPAIAERIAPWLRWKPSRGWAVAMACLFIYTLTQMSEVSEFLYFQF